MEISIKHINFVARRNNYNYLN